MDWQGFQNRFKWYLQMTDPSTLFYSSERVLKAKEALTNKQELNAEELTFNSKLVNAAVHPVTGEVIPALFRVSAIAPANIPIVFAMLTCPASNIPGTLFLHWLNQSYNTACNYANRSGSDQSLSSLAKAYVLAVTSACSLAYGLGKVVERGPAWVRSSGALIPCVATAAANISNIGFTRMDEITMGTKIFDSDGKEYGVSSKAGLQCVGQTALTRCVLVPCSCLLIPPVVMSRLGRLKLLPTSPRMRMLVELGVIYLSLQLALPAALAVFPQTASFPVQELEEKFHDLRRPDGSRVDMLFANKGL
ncbi:hypothetical protein EON64_14150 [archaeon]|nr:MAG: hypothetical protein EON64_14150 [archaeon]